MLNRRPVRGRFAAEESLGCAGSQHVCLTSVQKYKDLNSALSRRNSIDALEPDKQASVRPQMSPMVTDADWYTGAGSFSEVADSLQAAKGTERS